MKKRLWTMVIGLAAAVAVVVVPSAMAAFTTPKLEVTPSGEHDLVQGSRRAERRRARVGAIFVPTGTTADHERRRPARCSDRRRASSRLFALAGAEVPLEGQLVVAAPGQIPAATQQRVHPGSYSTACDAGSWCVSIARQTLSRADYLLPTAGPHARSARRISPRALARPTSLRLKVAPRVSRSS